MKRSFANALFVLSCFLATFPHAAFPQAVPADLEIIGSAGGLTPWDENQYLHISANGQATYARTLAGAIGQEPLEEKTFTLATTELERIWQAIQTNDFFNLPSRFTDSTIVDRTFARLIIRANGSTHEVTTQNIAIFQFDQIILALNEATPAETDLVYDNSFILPVFETEVCNQFDGIALKAHDLPWPKKAQTTAAAAKFSARAAATHPGTTVACHLSLQSAVDQGLVRLSAKGGVWGDQVSINVNNNPPVRCDNIQITLNMEFWGPGATPANVARIKQAIEAKWNGQMTSDGKTVSVQVKTRARSQATSPPGTPGFHQIELVGALPISYVSGDLKVNSGTSGGKWATSGPGLDAMYAHEAGHLLGLPDRYDDYRKQADGTWRREGDGKVLTSEELAKILAPEGQPVEPTKRWLERATTQRVSEPQPGHHDDLMATLSGKVRQSDIDALVAQAGLVVDVRPGEVLVNKDADEQNLVITRSRTIFVPEAGAIRLDGLYAACIDLDREVPSFAGRFDVGPPLDTWAGIDAASTLRDLLRYIDENEFFCEDDEIAQQSIWRITNNSGVNSDFIRDFLRGAGIELGTTLLDFPRLNSPASDDTTTAVRLPRELFRIRMAPAAVLANNGQRIEAKGRLFVPSLSDLAVTANAAWHLERPAESAAQLIDPTDSTVVFNTDVRGIYRATLRMNAVAARGDTASFEISGATRVVVPDNRTETFEDGEIEDGPFNWQMEGATYWFATDLTAHTGSFAAQSYFAFPGEPNRLQVTVTLLEAGEVSFAYRVATAKDLAFLTFYIDGEAQDVWSGDIDWAHTSYRLAPGRHTLTWEYSTLTFFGSGPNTVWIDDVFFPPQAVFTSVEPVEGRELPREFALLPNYPNPFNPGTQITYHVASPGHVSLKVFDLLGREVATLVDAEQQPGVYRVHFGGSGLQSGLYFYRITAGQFTATRRMLLLK